ncbi:MAG: hypothetical protein U9Q67_01690 [Patescibacteria group bacterium]|nr:hypothetical protein [Patescibacteria group bacterium]
MAVVPYENTMKQFLMSPMKKAYTFVGVTLFFILVFLLGAIRPTFQTISELKGEIRQRESVETVLQTKINDLQEIQSVYNSIEDDLDFIDIFFPADTDYSLLMASLERITGSYGYDMVSLGIGVDDDARPDECPFDAMEPVEIRITMVGRMTNLVAILEHLEGLPVVPEITGVTLAPSDKLDDSSLLDINISMLAYKTINYDHEEE